MTARRAPQAMASDPDASVFVRANAGSGKTWTLVQRVARLLLAGARPSAVLCVTYTKAAAAEMQRRLFSDLGEWAVMDDGPLTKALARIGEGGRDLSKARALFAQALETPGGLKIETLHAFCEKLLRRFPLEAGVSPGFAVLEEAEAAKVAARARETVAALAAARPDGPVAQAYAHFSIALDYRSFNAMFDTFAVQRAAIEAYVARCAAADGVTADVWRRCGFSAPTTRGAIEARALGRIRWGQWKRAADALAASATPTDRARGVAMHAIHAASSFAEVWAIFTKKDGQPLSKLTAVSLDPAITAWMFEEQARHRETAEQVAAASIAEETLHALMLASAYATAHGAAKAARGALDFGDLIHGAHQLLTVRADAAWVLYKLDGGLDHVLLDEAQDTAPMQWDIIRALTEEFFAGHGAGQTGRTVFAVGDEKQSIFSFQGAAPERLLVEGQAFSSLAADAGQRFANVSLRESWRSAPEVLAFVDKVVDAPGLRQGLSPDDGERVRALPITHIAQRDPGGCVELWPLEPAGESPVIDPWGPVDAESEESANKRLARRLAAAVRAMIERREGVSDRASKTLRPCTAGDVLVLVRRRGPLFHEIIRALKREGVAVAGADRLKLSEHGVFADLQALGRFARFADDDLTLASLLRGPLCDLDEASLFDLAHGRKGSLWRALGDRAEERPQWRAAADVLTWAEAEGERATPLDFYSRALSRLDGAGRTMRQRILTRMGAEGEEALDAFLAQAQGAEARGVHDLETFLAAIGATTLEIRREADEGPTDGGEARVMTVHGAKGLEAPIVILPDTTTRATAQAGPLLATSDGGFLWAPRAAEDCAASLEARAAREAATMQESARLLYVAITRARDRLIACGVESQPSRFKDSWYEHLSRAFDELPVRAFALEGGGTGWRYGADPSPVEMQAAPRAPAPALPAWSAGLAPAESPLARYASPSRLGEEAQMPAPSPLARVDGLGRYRRGDLIHRLLQSLPDLGEDERAAAAARLLDRERDLTADQRAEIAQAALAVLGDARFSEVFGAGSRAEAAIVGTAASLPEGLRISGRVDRLVVTESRVLVVDFKTNRPAPERIEDVDPAYIRQMAIYAAVLGEVFPGRAVDAALIWTDGPRVTPVPPALMAASLEALAAAR